jgi:hypothetical protein
MQLRLHLLHSVLQLWLGGVRQNVANALALQCFVNYPQVPVPIPAGT